MKNLILKKNGRISPYRIIISLSVILLFIFISFNVAVSIKYDISPHYTAKQTIRKVILSAIYVSTLIHDPAETIISSTGPDNIHNYANKEYIRIENFFDQADNQHTSHIKNIRNEKIIKSKFQFSYQPYEEPKLKKLREKYNLDNIIASAKSELECMVLLRNWVRSQFRRNDYQPYTDNFDILEVLKKNIRNKNNESYKPDKYRPCHFFPLFYSQVLLSMGYQVRMVQISFHGYDGHGNTEVWSNQYKKWIIMDPDLNLYYERNGIPLNLLEVHNARYEKNPNIKIVREMQTSGDDEWKKEVDVANMIQYHSYFQIKDMRNDWMTNQYFKGHPKRSDNAALFWVDEKMPPLFNLNQKTDNAEDFYWTLNQTEIMVKKDSQMQNGLALAFNTFTPNYKQFEIIIDDSEKIIFKDAAYVWKPHSGKNKLSICSINKFGIYGIPSSVEIWME